MPKSNIYLIYPRIDMKKISSDSFILTFEEYKKINSMPSGYGVTNRLTNDYTHKDFFSISMVDWKIDNEKNNLERYNTQINEINSEIMRSKSDISNEESKININYDYIDSCKKYIQRSQMSKYRLNKKIIEAQRIKNNLENISIELEKMEKNQND